MVIGNSSSGILEIPSLYTPTLNIGIRQSGRVQGKSVYNSNFTKNQIVSKIRLCLKLKLKKTLNSGLVLTCLGGPEKKLSYNYCVGKKNKRRRSEIYDSQSKRKKNKWN